MEEGVSEESITAGGKALEKKIEAGQREAYLAYLSALSYKAFVMKRRDMKYVVSALQAAKPMLEIHVNDLDRDGFLLNTPGGHLLSCGRTGGQALTTARRIISRK